MYAHLYSRFFFPWRGRYVSACTCVPISMCMYACSSIFLQACGCYFHTGSSVNMALRCGVSVFYEVLKYINLEARLYPPTCQFFTTCVQVLGQVNALCLNPMYFWDCSLRCQIFETSWLHVHVCYVFVVVGLAKLQVH